jgi:uncharacterized membrane protein
MTTLVLAVSFFLGLHLLVSGTPLRAAIIARTGAQPYLGLFSLLSLLGIAWMVMGYRRAPMVPLWAPLPGGRVIALVLTLLAFLLVVIGLTTPSPTVVGGEQQLERADPVRGILRVTRHPFLWGVALWALAHLLVNGDLASALLFGTFFALALLGPMLIDRRRAGALGARWESFVATTSSVPFAAIVAGRNALRVGELGIWRIVLALVLFVVVLELHPWLFGVSPLP